MTASIWLWLERQVRIGWLLAAVVLVIIASAGWQSLQHWLSVLQQAQRDQKQRDTPVVTMQGRLVAVEKGNALVHVSGVKHRECTYAGIQGFSVDRHGVQHDAIALRTDVIEQGRTKPVGEYDIGVWSIAPVVADAIAVKMYVQHNCSGTMVTTMIADVALTQAATAP